MDIGLVNKIITIIIITSIGYLLRKKEIFNEKTEKDISFLILNVAIPGLILSSANTNLESDSIKTILIVFLGGVIYHFLAIIIGILGAKALKLEKGKKEIFIALTSFSNVAFIGYPIISVFLPENGIFYATFFVTVFNFIFYSFGVMIISGEKKLSLKAIFTSLPTLSSIVMVVFFALQIKFPPPLQETFVTLGNLSTPLSILVVGSMLGGFKFKELFLDYTIYIASFFRLILIPTITFFILGFLPIDLVSKTIILVMSGLPPGNATAIVAKINNTDWEYASKGVLQGVLLFLPTAFYLSFLVSKL